MLFSLERAFFVFASLALFATLLVHVPAYAKEQKVYHVPPHKIVSHIAKQKGRKKAIVVWASWCPFCRKNMDNYIWLENSFPGSMIMVSVDNNLEQLKNYLDKKDLAPLKIIITKNPNEQNFSNAFSRLGVKPFKGLPTVILLDENNKVIQQGSGSSIDIAAFLRQQERFRPKEPTE